MGGKHKDPDAIQENQEFDVWGNEKTGDQTQTLGPRTLQDLRESEKTAL